MQAAEAIEANGEPDEISCTAEARHVYLAATLRFKVAPTSSAATPTFLVKRPGIEFDDDRVETEVIVGTSREA